MTDLAVVHERLRRILEPYRDALTRRATPGFRGVAEQVAATRR